MHTGLYEQESNPKTIPSTVYQSVGARICALRKPAQLRVDQGPSGTYHRRGGRRCHLFCGVGIVAQVFHKGSEEIITHLGTPGHLISSSVSFLQQKPSDYQLDALIDSEVWILRYPTFQTLLQQDIRFVRLARLVTLEWLLQKEQMEHDFLLLSSKERFIKFAQEEPQLMATVPQRMLASYLNIQPETFSRYKQLLKP